MMGPLVLDYLEIAAAISKSQIFLWLQPVKGNGKSHESQKKHVKGNGPGKGRPEKGQPKSKKNLKRPATLALPNKNDPGLSLEEKMENFHKKTNGNTQEFLDNLSGPQRERLWGRFARARKSLKDENLNSLWDKHCKGEGSEQFKKKLLGIYLKNKGDLKKGNAYAKELVEISEATGILVAFDCGLQPLAISLFLSQLRLQGDIRMGTIQCHPYKVWPEGGNEKGALVCIF